jgi:hypothetical protein
MLFKPPFKSAEHATKPAKTVSARIEERSNAFMGKAPVFFLGYGGCPGSLVGRPVSGLKYTEQIKIFK